MTRNSEIPIQFEYSARSVAGVRPVNEDAWCAFPVKDGLVCAVADGIGGHEAGDVASALAIRIFGEVIQDADTACRGGEQMAGEVLERAHTLAHEAILEESKETSHAGMGTTLVSAWFFGETVTLCNSGDSRCTLIRSGIVMPLTKDHSLVQDLVDKGVLTPEEALSHPMKNIITRSLGGEFIADTTIFPLHHGDTLVLSSDGLHDYVSREAMVAVGNADTTDDAASLLLEDAAKTSKDNITLIVVRVKSDETEPKPE